MGLNSEFKGHVKTMCQGGLLGLLSKTQEEVWDFFEYLAWDTYEFKQAKMNLKYHTHDESALDADPYSRGHLIDSHGSSYDSVPPMWCDYCKSSTHDACSCPYRDCFDAHYASLEKRINELTAKMVEIMKARITEHSQCFNQSRENCHESDSCLRYHKSGVSLFDDFEPSYSARPDLNENMCLPSLEQESDLPQSLSRDLAPCPNSPKGVTDDVLVSVDLPTTLNDFHELEVGKQSDFDSELDICIIPAVEFHDLDESKDVSQKLHEEVIVTAPAMFDFDDILSAGYESFSYKLDVTEGFDVDSHFEYESFSFDPIMPDLLIESDDNILQIEYESFCGFDVKMSRKEDFRAEYESFSVDPVQTDPLLEYCSPPSVLASLDPPESTFVESETFVFDIPCLDQTHMHIELKGHVDLEPFALPRQLIHDNPISRPMTSPLAYSEYVHFIPEWAQLFDKLKRALTCAFLTRWMYSIWFQLPVIHSSYAIESWTSEFDKLLRALTSFDLRSTFSA